VPHPLRLSKGAVFEFEFCFLTDFSNQQNKRVIPNPEPRAGEPARRVLGGESAV
jgi:hypothetical protein